MIPHGRQTRLATEGLYLLAVAAFVLAGAWIHQINLLLIVGAMMFGPLLFNGITVWIALSRLHLERKSPATIGAGELLVVRLQLSNQRRRFSSRAIVVRDRLVRENGRDSAAGARPVAEAVVLAPRVAPGSIVSQSYEGPAPARGAYRFGPLSVSTRFPFGLARRTVVNDDPATLIVYPQLGTLTPAWRSLHQMSHAGQRQLHPRQSSSEADFYAMRDWRTGDSNRWVHWPTTARRGALVVRQFEQKRHSDLVLLADLWLPPEPTDADHRRLELAIRFLATVAAETCRSGGDRLHLAIVGRDSWQASGAASSGMQSEILYRLAVAEGGDGGRLADSLRWLDAATSPAWTALFISTRDVDPHRLETAAGAGGTASRGTRRWTRLQAGTESMSTYFQTDDVFASRPEFAAP
jgi:uncharacterized protein (DUF58 family)